ncbi:MAG TPA: hypothetical protein VG797_09330 [Phycisphaerales bacterium]|nr:hypothetical protein [Phycisphaerales bacterium]
MIRLLAEVPLNPEAAATLSKHQELRAILMIVGVAVAGLVAMIVLTMVRFAARQRRKSVRTPAGTALSPWEEAGRRAKPIDEEGNPPRDDSDEEDPRGRTPQ